MIFQTTLDFLITPFSNAALADDEDKVKFNETLCRGRVVVEQCIGQTKMKFPVLRTGIRLKSIKRTAKLIQVLFAIR